MHDTATERAPLAQLSGLLRLLRPRQWVKNGFVLAPLLFTGLFLEPAAVRLALLATLLFCVASSAAYVVNDIHDIDSDRRHPTKAQTRPLAAGDVTIPAALFLLAGLLTALTWGWFVARDVVLVIGAYLALNLAYSFVLKHQPVLDIFTIAIGFVLRVSAGAAALDVPVSAWMFITTLCLALYLAALKRRTELALSGAQGRRVLEQYSVELIDRYAQISASGALMFYSMFVISSRPELVITIPLVIFGLFRYWYIVDATNTGESPADALLADWQLLLTVLLWVAACGWEMWPAHA